MAWFYMYEILIRQDWELLFQYSQAFSVEDKQRFNRMLLTSCETALINGYLPMSTVKASIRHYMDDAAADAFEVRFQLKYGQQTPA